MAVIKQYVNLPTGTTNIHGSTRQIRVPPSSVPDVGVGHKAEWWVAPDGVSNTSILYINPASRNPTAPSGQAGAKMTQTLTSLTTAGANAGFFVNTINFPHVGGDRYVAKVSRQNNRDGSQDSDVFETWRKMFYTVYHMPPDGLTFFNALEQKFKDAYLPAFMEWVNVAKVACLTVMQRVDMSANFAAGSFPFMSGLPGSVMNLKPTGTGTLNNKPFHTALLVVPEIYDITPVARTHLNQTSLTGQDLFPTFNLHTDASTTLAFIATAQVTWTGHAAVSVRDRFSVVQSGPPPDGCTVAWDVSAVPGLTHWLATAGHKFNLAYTIRRENTQMGWSWNNFCVSRTIDGSTDVLQTFTHEIGHGVGQTVRTENRWNEAGAPISPDINLFSHRDMFGGQGPHCSTNAVLAPASAASIANGATSGQTFRWGGAGLLCTMFYRGDRRVDPDGKFCPACVPRLQRMDVGLANQTTRGWNFFG